MLLEELLILGTSPLEIFYGCEGAKRLLQGDWKYWGQLALDVERTALSRADSALYFVMQGQIRLDRWCFRIPIRNNYKILLVEDDTEISEMLKSYLATENYDMVCAFDGEEACNKFDAAPVHLVLLDLMIPKMSGMDVMQHIRKSSFVPIIIISAKDTESDKTLGLGLGADDYITKPFSVVEVLARIKAALRRRMQYDNAAVAAPAILTVWHMLNYSC